MRSVPLYLHLRLEEGTKVKSVPLHLHQRLERGQKLKSVPLYLLEGSANKSKVHVLFVEYK